MRLEMKVYKIEASLSKGGYQVDAKCDDFFKGRLSFHTTSPYAIGDKVAVEVDA